MQIKPTALLVAAIMTAASCTHSPYSRNPSSADVAIKYDARRGSPAEYDPGAPANSKWVELFGSTPNYRALGIEALGGTAKTDEKFRWEFGPMWYRGRLTPESVKVFVVGQEGAQDENVSNRAFTGSTGTRTQRFLNHLGIHRSYLFLNTFVYTINGQLEDDPRFKWIEQGSESPIVDYRHKLFDHMLETNSQTVALFMGVGAGGKASLATWINARGGKCSVSYEMKNCDTTGMAKWFQENRGITIKNKILAIGVPHPGGANPNLGGADAMKNIIAGFSGAANRVAEYKVNNQDWLPQDIDEKATPEQLIARLQAGYEYKGYAPIPFRDFAFNTNWRMGSQGTTSNRWGAYSIQVYSDAGEYNDKNSTFAKPYDLDSGLNADKTALIGMSERDLPYESPRYNASTWSAEKPNYDFGPCGYLRYDEAACELGNALVSWPDLKQAGINYISHESFGYFGTYRGRAKGAQVYVIADQTSHDDFFSARAITGAEGQKFQSVLDKSGVGLNYFIQRTLPVDTLGVAQDQLIAAINKPEIAATHKRIYQAVASQADIKVIVTLGPVAKAAVANLGISDKQIISIDSLVDLTTTNNAIKAIASALGQTPSGEYTGELKTIPREDLPYHSRWWMGSSGDRGGRGENYSLGNYYRVYAPNWVSRLYPLSIFKIRRKTSLRIFFRPNNHLLTGALPHSQFHDAEFRSKRNVFYAFDMESIQ
jgi:hypothetical protein